LSGGDLAVGAEGRMSRLRSPVIVVVAVFAAVALNLIVFAIGAALGANYRFVSQGSS